MILGIPAEQVIDEYHEKHHAGEQNAAQYLERKGVRFEMGDPFMGVKEAGLYLLTVPSLNLQAINHNILYLMWPSEKEGYFYHELLDPNRGREGRLYYKLKFEDSNDPLAVNLGSLIVDLVIKDWEKYVGE